MLAVHSSGEYLFVIQNTTATDVTYLDVVSTSTDPLALVGYLQ